MKIVHFSDLHLTAKDNQSRSEPKLFGRLEGMNEAFRRLVQLPQVRDADLLLVTGDITDSGDLDAWKVFWDAVGKAGLMDKTLVVPGNHDVCCLGLRLGLRPNLWKSDIERMVKGLEMGRQSAKFPWARKINGKVVVIGVEANNEGNLTALSNAVGSIGFIQFEALGRLLWKHRATPVKIVAIHHSPNIPGEETAKKRKEQTLGKLDRLAMQMDKKDREFLRILSASHNVRLIVHGHIHFANAREATGVRIIGAPATTEPSEKDGKYRYYEYKISPSGKQLKANLVGVALPAV